jgi:hypothetical protein
MHHLKNLQYLVDQVCVTNSFVATNPFVFTRLRVDGLLVAKSSVMIASSFGTPPLCSGAAEIWDRFGVIVISFALTGGLAQ